MTEQIEGQLSFVPSEADERLRRWHLLQDMEVYTRVDASNIRGLPGGTEVLLVHPGRDYDTGAPRMEKNRYYRTIVQHVRLRFSPDVRLVSEPSGEWPERPPWQCRHGEKQWILPDFSHYYYIRNHKEG